MVILLAKKLSKEKAKMLTSCVVLWDSLSMDKVISHQQVTDKDAGFSQENHSLSSNDLSVRLKKLSFLALHFDPYSPNLEDETLRNLVHEFKMEQFISNPFQFTNQLLLLIDNTENELKSIAQ
jgi:hypothetical protein